MKILLKLAKLLGYLMAMAMFVGAFVLTGYITQLFLNNVLGAGITLVQGMVATIVSNVVGMVLFFSLGRLGRIISNKRKGQ